jgi:CO/xanthine dehydrogenase FAD-binding subunit
MEYRVARSLEEALRLVGSGGRPLAGGTDLAVVIADGIVSPRELVDVAAVPEMQGIRRTPKGIAIGASVTVAEAAAAPGLPACLTAGALAIGSPQIRNLATIGGNICNASPCGDTLAPLIALAAVFTLASAAGRRDVPAEDFFLGPKKTVLRPDELLLEVLIPTAALAGGSAFRMIGKRNGQVISQVNAALWLRVEKGAVAGVRAAVGSVAPVPLRLRTAEAVLQGARADRIDRDGFLSAVDAEISPITDVRARLEYRRLVTGGLFRDILEEALRTAGGAA